jgi:RNA polymerase sigma-70 factor (ECF subfamily)
MAMEDDALFYERLRQGDPEASREVVTSFGDRLLRAAYLLCRNEPDAQDLVQETFCQALRSAKNFQGRSALYTWLYGILRHVFLLHCRKKRRFHWLSKEKASAFVSQENVPLAEQRRKFGHVARALDELPIKYREILLLRYFEGLKIMEIANLLKISPGTVKSRLHHATRRLRRKLVPEGSVMAWLAEERTHEM